MPMSRPWPSKRATAAGAWRDGRRSLHQFLGATILAAAQARHQAVTERQFQPARITHRTNALAYPQSCRRCQLYCWRREIAHLNLAHITFEVGVLQCCAIGDVVALDDEGLCLGQYMAVGDQSAGGDHHGTALRQTTLCVVEGGHDPYAKDLTMRRSAALDTIFHHLFSSVRCRGASHSYRL